MPSILFGTGAYQRNNGNFPPLTLINMFVEQAKTSEKQIALLSRKGLATSATRGSGPINGIYSRPGLYSGAIFTISGDTLYKDGTSLGTVSGSGAISWASSDTELVVTRGGSAYSYNGTNLAAIAFPDSADVKAVTFIGSLFVFVRAGSGKFYWSDPLDGRTVDALNFATAEREGDKLLDIATVGDNILLLGQDSTELWEHTGEADLPFTRFEQVAPDRGIHSTGAKCKADNTVFAVGNNCSVYRWGAVWERVSDHGIEERLLAASTINLFPFQFEGHEFVTIRTDAETLLFDVATKEWCEFQTSEGNWIAKCATMVGSTPYFGNSSDGKVMIFSGWADLSVELERRFTFAAPLDTPLSINRLSLWANVGQSDVLSGTGSDPIIEFRFSDDAGQTWSDWDDDTLGNASIGGAGEYRAVPEVRALGMYDFPGFMGEARVTDPVPFRVSAVKVNDPAGGRQRG